MNVELSAVEQQALESFRAGDEHALTELAPESLQRVMRRMTIEELANMGSRRQTDCPHSFAEVKGQMTSAAGTFVILRCLDCGLVYERPQ
jgi:hypothetical protein